MSKTPKISDAELQVLQVLWDESPMGATELADRIGAANGWTLATVKTLLSRLLVKGAIKAETEGRRFRYRPVVKREAVAGRQAGNLVERLFGGRISPLVAQLAEQREIDPEDLAELEELPGIGHKSASVVMTQAFGVPSFPVDTHIHRLAQRWKLTNGRNVEQTEKDLKKLFPREHWNPLHLRIIYYGREHCTAWGCDGMKCQICRELFPDRKRPLVTRK